jgi:hypothetical protein
MYSLSLDAFLKLAAQGNLIPVRCSCIEGETLMTTGAQLLTAEQMYKKKS